MREIVLDTETTGIDPATGHRIVEIGCIELISGTRSGKFFHSYLNPERDMPEEAYRVHGLSFEFLLEHPTFAEKVDEFLDFIADSPLVIHNAAFDMKFINAELTRCGFAPVAMSRAIDTVLMARKKFPGSPASLDALCKRFGIDSSHRTKHGALLDAELLSEVYIELMGGKQVVLSLEAGASGALTSVVGEANQSRAARDFPPSEEERMHHEEMLKKIKNPIWAA
ncbi:MAG: DNA polymerase III subunit epsilon [Rickettsiales bacterium]|jgi:DNA polymerase-3 subunit epsilon|nr:DNA polymerase III subunit epsilon [Rickettsiales bacterium]